MKYLPFYKEKKLDIQSNNFNQDEATFMAAFGNGTFFCSGMNITPEADGEIVGYTPASIRVEKKALSLKVP